MVLKARLLNEMEVDITNWVFRDVTPGRKAFRLENASSGTSAGEVEVGKSVHLNGDKLPASYRVEWSCGDKSGTVPADQTSGDATRIDIEASALSELAAEVYNGKTITFKVRGNKANASVKATLKYAAPAQPTITKVYSEGKEDTGKVASTISKLYIKGTGLNAYELENLSLYGADDPLTIPAGASLTKTDTEIVIDCGSDAIVTGCASGDDFKVKAVKSGLADVEFTTEIA